MTRKQQTLPPPPRPSIAALEPYQSARHTYSGTEAIWLDANENPYPKTAFLNRYPDPLQVGLRTAMAKYYRVPVEQIFSGNGSDEAIDLLLRGWCEPGRDKALTFTPTYGMYKVSAAINGVPFVEIPLDAKFQPVQASYEKLLRDPALKIVFLCSPNNPTGNLMNRDTIKYILENYSGLVVVDEAYIEFANVGSLTSWCKKYPHLVVLRTMSKAWGLAGARVGAAIAHPQVVQVLQNIKPPYNLSSMAQHIASAALLEPDLMENDVQMLLKARKVLVDALRRSPHFTKVYPTQANFVLATTPYAPELYHYLAYELPPRERMVVRRRDSEVPGALRITVGPLTQMVRLKTAIENFIP